MGYVYFVRHGETDCSAQGRFCSRHDPVLNDAGRKAITTLKEICMPAPWQQIYSSPSRRAVQTARLLSDGVTKAIEVDDRLMELNYGTWDHLFKSEVMRTDEYQSWCANPDVVPPPNGETVSEVASRSAQAVNEFGMRHPEMDILCVSHKATIRILFCHYLGVDLRLYKNRFAMPLGSLSCIRVSNAGPMLMGLSMNSAAKKLSIQE